MKALLTTCDRGGTPKHYGQRLCPPIGTSSNVLGTRFVAAFGIGASTAEARNTAIAAGDCRLTKRNIGADAFSYGLAEASSLFWSSVEYSLHLPGVR